MDPKHLSSRASYSLCDANSGHGDQSWTACYARGARVSSLPGTLGRGVGCESYYSAWACGIALTILRNYQRSNISDLLLILQGVFAKEPPVRNRQQMPPQPQTQQTTPPPLPPLPPGMGPSPTPQVRPPSATPISQTPPQLPPKPGATTVPQHLQAQIAERYQSPPPLPPLPRKDYHPSQTSSLSHASMASPGGHVPQQYVTSPPPAHQLMPLSASQSRIPYGRNTSEPISPSAGPQQAFTQHTGPSVPQMPTQQPPHFSQVPPSPYPGNQPRSQQSPGPPYPTNSPHPSSFHRPPPAAPASQETPDLLTSPFEVELPSFAPTGPAPPIPPNPEKDALLHAISQSLAETLRAQATQSDTASQSLVSQSRSLQATMATLQGELTALNSLHTTLQSNTAVLQQSIHRADATIADAQARSASVSSSAASSSAAAGSTDPPSGLPPIDEVLVAPTVVGKQLYDLVAEEQGLQHALYALQAALVRGVIGVDSWSRHTRGLAREAFLKRALIRKIGRGMGLEESEA
jgi:ESCRT-I complex subunit TSG101